MGDSGMRLPGMRTAKARVADARSGSWRDALVKPDSLDPFITKATMSGATEKTLITTC